MITISLCMIVKNEETVLERCLKSVSGIVDEIIIVDTGSTDNTVEISRKYTNNVYNFEWVNDFSKARNFAFSKATKDYQFWLDADDVIFDEDRKKFIHLKKTLSLDVDMVVMLYNTHFDKSGLPIFTSHRERLIKRINNYNWQDPVHECIPLQGNIFNSDVAISHQKINKNTTKNRNLMIYQKYESEGAKFTPRQMYYYARELKDHGINEKAVRYFEDFLNSNQGWYEDNIAACFNLSILYNILNKQEKILEILFRSFKFDSPRAEICCEIGYYYKRLNDFSKAIQWFKIALTLETNSMGFILNDYWGFIPNIELAVCYFNTNNLEKAIFHNNQAAKFKPNSNAVIHNKKIFDNLKK